MTSGNAAKITIYLVFALSLLWWFASCVSRTVLTWERIIASDADEDTAAEQGGM